MEKLISLFGHVLRRELTEPKKDLICIFCFKGPLNRSALRYDYITNVFLVPRLSCPYNWDSLETPGILVYWG